MATWRNRGRIEAQLLRIPAAQKARVQAQGDIEARGLANAVRRAAPVGHDLEKHPGELRDSVHPDKGKRELSWRVVIDAADAKGRFIARHVEFGHMDARGGHVPPVPFAYPTLRVEMPAIRRRLARAGREGAIAAAPTLAD